MGRRGGFGEVRTARIAAVSRRDCHGCSPQRTAVDRNFVAGQDGQLDDRASNQAIAGLQTLPHGAEHHGD
jgi:hypothetical protein